MDNFSSYLMYFYHHRSPDLSSSRDDDDAGYNSTKADEVHCSWSQLNHWFFLNCLLRNQSFLCFLGTSNLDDLMNSLNCIMNVPIS